MSEIHGKSCDHNPFYLAQKFLSVSSGGKVHSRTFRTGFLQLPVRSKVLAIIFTAPEILDLN